MITKSDVVERMGEPDAVLPKGAGMRSAAWRCGKCRHIHLFDEPVRAPSPCHCGSIFFEKVARPTH